MSETNRNAHSIEYASCNPTPRTSGRSSPRSPTPKISKRRISSRSPTPGASRARNDPRKTCGRRNSSHSSTSEAFKRGNSPRNSTSETFRRGVIRSVQLWGLLERKIVQLQGIRDNRITCTGYLAKQNQKCDGYKQQIAKEKNLKNTLQERFLELENQLNKSTQQLTELQTENEQERKEMDHLQKTLQRTWKVLIQVRGRSTKKDRIWNLTAKNALHAKRVAEEKLQEALEKYAMEIKRSNELEESTKALKV
ncbi:hypothetical protein DINM_020445 [Dirofilaria immitis]|nr:hypothetical protein [Dirofilaria immitis]